MIRLRNQRAPSHDGKRSFNKSWYNNTCVEYSFINNAAYCFACRHFGVVFDNAWVKEGFQNWKKGPKEHIESKKHVDAMALWEMYRDKKVKGESVLSQLSTANSEARRVPVNG